MTMDTELTAAYDQTQAAGNERLDLYLASVRKHTAGQDEIATAVILSWSLRGLPAEMVRDLYQAAIRRLLAQETEQEN
jgi:hypothetical protein